MQNKIDTLTDIIKGIKSPSKRKYAIAILNDLVNIINSQENEILGLTAWKTNNTVSDIECEQQKYVLLLIILGYSQFQIKTLRTETLIFAAENKKSLTDLSYENMKYLDLWIMTFQLEKQSLPKNSDELKKFINEAKG